MCCATDIVHEYMDSHERDTTLHRTFSFPLLLTFLALLILPVCIQL